MYINSISNTIFTLSTRSGYIDLEERKIARRLMAYGITPTGNKSIDRSKLYQVERQEAERLDKVCDKFLTVSVKEQQDIQNVKNSMKIARSINNSDHGQGAKALGEQVYLAIKMRRHRAVG